MRHRIGDGLQRLDVVGARLAVAAGQPLDAGLEPVRHLAQAHRAGEARAALQGVQGAHAGGGMRGRRRLAQPVAQLAVELGQQLLRLFLEDREQLEVDGIDRVDVVVDLAEGRGPRRRRTRRPSGAAASGFSSETPSGVEGAQGAEHRRRRLVVLDAGLGGGRRRGRAASATARRRPARRAVGASIGRRVAVAPRASTGAAAGRCRRFGAAAAAAPASATGAWPSAGTSACCGSLAAGASSRPSSDSSGSTAIAGSTGDSLSLPSASSDAAVAASRRSAELSSCSERRTSSSGAGWCRKPAANWCSRRRISSAALTNRRASSSVPLPITWVRASACSSRRARCERSVKPTVAELPASEWASEIGTSPTGRCSSIAHSATSVIRRRDSSSASLR